MKPILLDFSDRTELTLRAQIIGDFNAASIPTGARIIIVGAFARDLLLRYRYGIDTIRSTEDVDLAMACESWDVYEGLRSRLIASGNFTSQSRAKHCLRHRSGIPIDLVPFGGLETEDRKIVWPPGDRVMDVFGFSEVLATALDVIFPGQARLQVISLPALALLKVICWRDRHYATPGRDASDLYLIMRRYIQAGNEIRLWEEFLGWTEEDSFDYEFASARMLGHDIGKILPSTDCTRIVDVLVEQSSIEKPAPMPREMNPRDPARARMLLTSLLQGLREHIGDRGRD